jgi:N-acyl-D-aspartate/D-glutamate deacylase
MGAELAIRGGTLIDGTGAPARRADVGIAGDRIAEIAPIVRAPRELDAAGCIVVPGFIDIHTHYDPQVLWDSELTPSSWHGVTSVVAGSCGYSLAPTRPSGRATLLRTLDKVEDMRIATLEAGVAWDFESYAEYLDAVARRGTRIHFGGYVGHTPVRIHVMGEAAYERHASAGEIEQMRRLVAEAIRGGALGFSTDRAGFHLGDGGRPVPSIAASQEETEALMRVTAEIGQGVVHVAPGENYRWAYDAAARLGLRLNWSALLTYPPAVSARGDYREKLAYHAAQRAAGSHVTAQVTCRPIVQQIEMSEPTAFYTMGEFSELAALPPEARPRLFEDRAWRARVAAALDRSGLLSSRWDSAIVVESATQPALVGRSLGALARERETSAWDALCDIAAADRLATRVEIPFANDDTVGVTALLRAEGCILGLSDAGAHVSQICDAVMPTDFLANWVRERGVMPLERGIHKLTGEIADVLGLDRGRLRVGAPADLAVFDYERLAPGPVRRVRDMPAGGERLVADRPSGVEHVLVDGVPIRCGGKSAENEVTRLPGTILRATPVSRAR